MIPCREWWWLSKRLWHCVVCSQTEQTVIFKETLCVLTSNLSFSVKASICTFHWYMSVSCLSYLKPWRGEVVISDKHTHLLEIHVYFTQCEESSRDFVKCRMKQREFSRNIKHYCYYGFSGFFVWSYFELELWFHFICVLVCVSLCVCTPNNTVSQVCLGVPSLQGPKVQRSDTSLEFLHTSMKLR